MQLSPCPPDNAPACIDGTDYALWLMTMQRSYQLAKSFGMTGPTSVFDRLVAEGSIRRFEDGEFIFQQGDPAIGLVMVVSGSMAVGRYRHDGTYNLLTVLGPGEVTGDTSYFAQAHRLNDGIAQGRTLICTVGGIQLDRLIDTDPEVARFLLTSMATQMHRMIRLIDAERRHPARIRLGWLLLQECDARDGLFDGSQQDLANRLGVSRVSLVSALAVLVDLGVVKRGYRKLWLTDRARLERWLAQQAGPAHAEP